MKQTLKPLSGILFSGIVAAAFLLASGCKKDKYYTKEEVDARVRHIVDSLSQYGEVEIYNGPAAPLNRLMAVGSGNNGVILPWNPDMRLGSVTIPGGLRPKDKVIAVSTILAYNGDPAHPVTSAITIPHGLVVHTSLDIHPSLTSSDPPGLYSLASPGWNDYWDAPTEGSHWSSRNGGMEWTGPAAPAAFVSVYARPWQFVNNPPQSWRVNFATQSLSVIVQRAK